MPSDHDDPDKTPWFRRTRPDGSMEPHATRGDRGEILILDGVWAASFNDGKWHEGILFSHQQVADFSPIQKQSEIYRLLEEARRSLGAATGTGDGES